MTITPESDARAEITIVESAHDLYRVWEIPGLRNADSYDGSGIIKTYNIRNTDRDYPTDPNAAPVLKKINIGQTTRSVNLKDVRYQKMTCPECDVDGRKSHSGEAYCPECGLLLSRTDAKDVDYHSTLGANGQPLSREPDDAGRV